MRNLQEQVKKAFCYQKLLWPLTVQTNCSSDLKIFANSRLSASNFKSFSPSLEQFFLAAGRNNFGNKIPFLESIPSFLYMLFMNMTLWINVQLESISQLLMSRIFVIYFSLWKRICNIMSTYLCKISARHYK